jgi:type I restriction enzyme S subunit
MEGSYNVALAKVLIPDEFDKMFVYYLLWSNFFQKPILDIERSAQDGFNKEDLEEIQLPIAPFPEQHRIVNKLNQLLARVEASKKRLDKFPQRLQRFRQSVLAAAFSGKLTADWREKNGNYNFANELLSEIKNSLVKNANNSRELKKINSVFESGHNIDENEFAEIPSNWLVCKIGMIGIVVNGSTPSRKVDRYWNGDIPWISSGEVDNNIISSTREKITKQGYNNSSVRVLPKGTVLIAMIGEGKTRGQVSILDIEATINQNIAAIILPQQYVNPKYLWLWFQFQYQNNREVGSGSGPQALNCDRVRQLPVVLVPIEEQKEIVRHTEQLFTVADKIEQRYTKAVIQVEKLAQSILSIAFRGELVPQDPNDEPVSELLARIKKERDLAQTKTFTQKKVESKQAKRKKSK